MIATRLAKHLEGVCPIDGVSVGVEEDKNTWRIDFSHNATDEQKAACAAAIAAFNPGNPTANDIRAEASKRMQSAFGARDVDHLDIIVANANREAIRLLRAKADREWTPAEETRAAALEAADLMLEAIRAASNVMEPNPPADYREDKHWPSVPGA